MHDWLDIKVGGRHQLCYSLASDMYSSNALAGASASGGRRSLLSFPNSLTSFGFPYCGCKTYDCQCSPYDIKYQQPVPVSVHITRGCKRSHEPRVLGSLHVSATTPPVCDHPFSFNVCRDTGNRTSSATTMHPSRFPQAAVHPAPCAPALPVPVPQASDGLQKICIDVSYRGCNQSLPCCQALMDKVNKVHLDIGECAGAKGPCTGASTGANGASQLEVHDSNGVAQEVRTGIPATRCACMPQVTDNSGHPPPGLNACASCPNGLRSQPPSAWTSNPTQAPSARRARSGASRSTARRGPAGRARAGPCRRRVRSSPREATTRATWKKRWHGQHMHAGRTWGSGATTGSCLVGPCWVSVGPVVRYVFVPRLTTLARTCPAPAVPTAVGYELRLYGLNFNRTTFPGAQVCLVTNATCTTEGLCVQANGGCK